MTPGKIGGRGEWIRTTGLLVPNQALYQAEPRPEDSQYNIPTRPAVVFHEFALMKNVLIEAYESNCDCTVHSCRKGSDGNRIRSRDWTRGRGQTRRLRRIGDADRR